MIGTIPADVIQYFGHIFRILQKLIYLYGWDDIFATNDKELDDATKTELLLFLGVMFGVQSANLAIAKIAQTAIVETEKNIVRAALTKGTVYPVVKKVAASVGIKINKQIFAKSVTKIVPILSAATSGGLTFVTFKPMAHKLQKHLESLPLANLDEFDESQVIDFDEIIGNTIEIDYDETVKNIAEPVNEEITINTIESVNEEITINTTESNNTKNLVNTVYSDIEEI